MSKITFITGNQNKADYLSKYLGFEVGHEKLELDEIQSLDLRKIVEHKLLQAFESIGSPVIVEDVALEFEALGGLPGPFIRFYVENIPFDTICRTLDGLDRNAVARCVFGYYDGSRMEFFEGSLRGKIADRPLGDNGFGWDKIFIPEGYEITRGEMDEDNDRKTYLKLKPFDKLKAFLEDINEK